MHRHVNYQCMTLIIDRAPFNADCLPLNYRAPYTCTHTSACKVHCDAHAAYMLNQNPYVFHGHPVDISKNRTHISCRWCTEIQTGMRSNSLCGVLVAHLLCSPALALRQPGHTPTPAINEGCTRSLRISHTSRRVPLQPVISSQVPCTPYHPPNRTGVHSLSPA